MLKRIFVTVIVCFVAAVGMLHGTDMKTGAEATHYKATSTYKEVMDFVFEAQRRSPHIRVLRLAQSIRDRMIPLVVISKEGLASPAELRMSGKPAVLFNANIHAGEVEGKEAVMMFMRDIVEQRELEVLESQAVLIVPIFNADGNEILGKNRRDNGPELAGKRYNGQFLDLNRDFLKMESPEMKGLIKVLNHWDPVLFVDLHTTNGSYHREPLTYTTLINPNGDDGLPQYMWKSLFPAVAERLKKTYGYDSVPYGNFADRTRPEKGWRNHAFGALYGTNYAGLRNRFTILDENYSHADFKTRVLACYGFVKSILFYTRQHIGRMQKMVRRADAATRDGYLDKTFALEYKVEKLMELTIKSYLFKVEKIKPEDKDKYPPWYNGVLVKKTDEHKDYRVDYLTKPVPSVSIPLPEAYIILPHHGEIICKLKHHGIIVEKMTAPLTASLENFVLESITPAKRLYQGHVFIEAEGKYKTAEVTVPKGAYYISMKQPLARLIPVLLEPQSPDGFFTWGFFNREIVSQWTGRPLLYPVYRVPKPAPPVERYQE